MKSILLFLFWVSYSITSLAQYNSAGDFNSFDGTKIYYDQNDKRQPIVLVHGFIVSGESCKQTILYKELQAAGYRVIFFDRRGNGKSDKPPTAEAYQSDPEANDIAGLLNFLHVKNYSPIGYSRGSILTARLLV